MRKLGKTEKVLILFLFRALISNLFGFFLINSVVSYIANKVDLSNEIYLLLSVAEVGVCAAVNSIAAPIGIKNNVKLFSFISQIPLFVLCIINFLSDNYSFIIFIIKIIIIALVSVICSGISEKKKRKIKVK